MTAEQGTEIVWRNEERKTGSSHASEQGYYEHASILNKLCTGNGHKIDSSTQTVLQDFITDSSDAKSSFGAERRKQTNNMLQMLFAPWKACFKESNAGGIRKGSIFCVSAYRLLDML